jgi:TRAP transporter TAXI family solute receptor
LAIFASLVAIAMIASGIYFYRDASSDIAHRKIVIATGSETGTYYVLGNGLKHILENTGAFASIENRATDGSEDNIRLISQADSGVDLAFVQGNATGSTNARLVATLYDEVLHILISKSGAQQTKSIYDLQGKRVSLGAAGSGTRNLSTRILGHFGIETAEDKILQPQEAMNELAAGTIDAVFLLSAIPSQLIYEVAAQDAVRFLSLGDGLEAGNEAHALELVIPGVKRNIIPRSTYARAPHQPVHTISVAATLVARSSLDKELVRYMTESIFQNRSDTARLEGSGAVVARNIRENYNPSETAIPYHPGAATYYRRQEPPFFVEYAEALSLGLTLLLAFYSVFIAFREWSRRRMKNRVDAYLLKVEGLVESSHSLAHDTLLVRQSALEELRREAFSDLIAERLLADEAFIILQNHLRDELSSVEQLIMKKARGSE